MEKEPEFFVRDPKLPSVNCTPTGNGMEGRRCTAPLPQNLTEAVKENS